jgi:CBS domain-containing protein
LAGGGPAGGRIIFAEDQSNMSVHDEKDRQDLLEEEQPGPYDLESTLFSKTLEDAAALTPIVVEPATTLAEVVRLMRENRRGCVLIASEGRLLGIFTERDVLMKVVGSPLDLGQTPVRDYMTPDPDTLPADSSIAYALNKMVLEGYRHIPLLDEQGRPSGVVSMRDLIEYISGCYQQEVLNLPPDPRFGPHKREGA